MEKNDTFSELYILFQKIFCTRSLIVKQAIEWTCSEQIWRLKEVASMVANLVTPPPLR